MVDSDGSENAQCCTSGDLVKGIGRWGMVGRPMLEVTIARAEIAHPAFHPNLLSSSHGR